MSGKRWIGLGAGLGAAVWAARRVAGAPPDPEVAERARAAQFDGPWQHNYAEVNGVRLHYVEMGSGPLVLLLHGFPECWYAWRHVMPQLAAHFRVVAPDMRGYNLSDKPRGVAQYATARLVGDVTGLITALGAQKAHVVGHDWGGGVAWSTGIMAGASVDRLVVCNAPHPAALLREFRRGEQLLRSYYMFFFQLPLFPEAAMRLVLRRSLQMSALNKNAFDEDALDVYENSISQPDAASAMLHYYRALPRGNPAETAAQVAQPISRPTMLLWGMGDFALIPALTEGLEEWVPNLRVERNEDSGHWVPEEQPQWVADKLLDFLR